MSQRPFSFLVVFLLIFSGEIFGQNTFVVKQFIQPQYIVAQLNNYTPFKNKFIKPQYLKANNSSSYNNFNLLSLPTADYYPNSLGIICKKELQLEKLTNIPFRFRLGSLDYVNWMEGKPNALKPN